MTPGHLTPPAETALADVLKRSLTFGPSVARRMGERLAVQFKRIENGEAIGHRHRFVALPDRVRCVNEAPLVIFFDTVAGWSCASSTVGATSPRCCALIEAAAPRRRRPPAHHSHAGGLPAD